MSEYSFRNNVVGELYRREISENRVIIVSPLTFGRARIGLGDLDDCAFARVY